MTEAELLREVIKLCEERSLAYHHCGDSRKCQGMPGLPDLCIVGEKILFAELKSNSGTTRPGQPEWRWRLLSSDNLIATWRPIDLEFGHIHTALDWVKNCTETMGSTGSNPVTRSRPMPRSLHASVYGW